MPRIQLGKTLVIANPAAHSGDGVEGAEFVRRFLTAYASLTNSFEMKFTEQPRHAEQIARSACGFDTIMALGGDGVINEVVNGIMGISPELRPRLAVIPLGSGNDYARTLGITPNDPQQAISELVMGSEMHFDLGKVNNTYFVETLSFGLDAMVSIDTMERRTRGTIDKGSSLFISSGIKVFSQGRRGWRYKATFDDGEVVEDINLIFAAQVGPTYGGGFKIAPQANPTDAKLSLCRSTGKVGVMSCLRLFGQARFGAHVNSKKMVLRDFSSCILDFEDEDIPAQADGEKIEGSHFEIQSIPQALSVLVGSKAPW